MKFVDDDDDDDDAPGAQRISFLHKSTGEQLEFSHLFLGWM